MTTKSITLYLTEDEKDREYQIHLQPKLHGYIVFGMYGRRGKATRRDDKTTSPVPLPAAEIVYDQLLSEKRRKGYTTDPSGKPGAGIGPATVAPAAPVVSGPAPVFVNLVALAANDLDVYLEKDEWMLQPLSVQDRLLLYYRPDGTVALQTGEGHGIPIPAALKTAFTSLPGRPVLEGYFDIVSSHFVVTDGYTDTVGAVKPFKERWDDLARKLKGVKMFELESDYRHEDKLEACAVLQESGRVGVVLRHLHMPYKGGQMRLADATGLMHEFNS